MFFSTLVFYFNALVFKFSSYVLTLANDSYAQMNLNEKPGLCLVVLLLDITTFSYLVTIRYIRRGKPGSQTVTGWWVKHLPLGMHTFTLKVDIWVRTFVRGF